MADEKLKENNELDDEELDAVAGGFGNLNPADFTNERQNIDIAANNIANIGNMGNKKPRNNPFANFPF